MLKYLKIILTITLFISNYIASADNSYIYYYGEGCSHCAKVDKYMRGVDGYNKLNIEKREVYSIPENAKKMSDDAKRLGVSEKNIGVPFMIINKDGVEIPLSGDGPIIDYFIPILGEAVENNTNKIIAISIIIIIGVGITFFAIKK